MGKHESKYWKSLQEFYKDPSADEAKAHEFMKGVTDDFELDKLSGMSRKQFLGLLSASAAFAAAGCTNYRDKGEIVPYIKKPEEITLGKANYYASTCTGCEHACGILIKTREGRPIKIDGNPDHPVNKGKLCGKGQAGILSLYDPDRLRAPMSVENGMMNIEEWKAVDTKIISALTSAAAKGKEIAVITHTITSPTTKKVFGEFSAKFPTVKIYSYELFNTLNRKSAWKKSTGSENFPLIQWDKAEIILSLESDFLGYEGNLPEQTRMFTSRRDVMKGKNFNRLYSADGTMNSTAMNADYRLRVRPDQQLEFVLSLINEFKPLTQYAQYTLSGFVKKNNLDAKIAEHLVDDLKKHKGTSIVHAGSTLPESVHVAVNLLNDILGNSALYNKNQSAVEHVSLAGAEEWAGLLNRMNGGQVGAVIHFDANPVYHLAQDLGYAEALKKVETVISLTEMTDESALTAKYVLPIHNNYEAWGDHKTRTGFISLQQPVINPLYKSRQKESALLVWANGNPDSFKETLYHEYLMKRWEKEVYPAAKVKVDFTTFWYSSLHDGVVTIQENVSPSFTIKNDAVNAVGAVSVSNDFVLFLHDNYTVGDGRFSNNGWLQELPHPASKITWDNYAALSPATAKALAVKEGDMIDVKVDQRSLELPVHVQPGLSEKFIAVMLGYGRTSAGTIGTGVGFNANRFMSKNASLSSWIYSGVQVTKTGNSYLLASTQEHHALDDEFLKDIPAKRDIILEGTVAGYQGDGQFLKKEHPEKEYQTITKHVEYNGVKWGLSIDLNKCTGCSICTLACNVENNIPVVGKDQVHRGREMAWIRIDRYFSGTPEAPTVSNQPMMCQQCDNAPCENVCPVVATTHSPDGLNQMIYNRCVGTKYCSNNCPYKVRRFNFYDFRLELNDKYQYQEPYTMANNPEVTVRSRGVMEKCTFCIQRIMEARETAIEENRPLKGSDVMTACQVACPADAIMFGDLHDTESKIYKYRHHELGYRVLEDLNIGPNVTYIAKLRNVEPDSEKA